MSSYILKRQAFISHTGGDEGAATFAANLAEALKRDGVSYFIDYDSLPSGCDWSEDINREAQRSEVMIVVLSPHYFLRYWCMRELDLAMRAIERGAPITIIPVYYHIPNLDNLKNPLAVAEWQQAWSAFREKTGVDVDQWINNLEKLDHHHQGARFSSTVKNREVDLMKKVALRVFQLVPQVLKVPSEGDFTTDLGPCILEVKKHFSQDVSVVGIVGGMGKSTLARAIYNELLPGFGYSRAASVEVGQEGDTSVSLTTVLKGLGAENEHGSVAEKKGQLETKLKQGPVLLLLDNLWTKEHLLALLPCYPAPGSRVLVTTRDSSVVTETAHRKQFVMSVLGEGSALALFRHHTKIDTGATSEAALQVMSGQYYISPAIHASCMCDLERDIVAACGGMPLALEVVGGQLNHVTSQDEWEEALDALSKGCVGDARLSAVLGLALDGENEAMFLDAATVFHGQSVQKARCAWQAMYKHLAVGSIFTRLCRMNLVKSMKNAEADCIWVHDVLRHLAGQRSMTKQPGKRMWKTNQELKASDVVSIVGSSLQHQEVSQRDQWQQITQLEVLLLDGENEMAGAIAHALLGGTSGLLKCIPCIIGAAKGTSRELKWIQCRSGAANGCYDAIARQQDLVVLDLSFCYSLTRLPESLCYLTTLQHLDLSGCRGLTSLSESLCSLTTLQHLNLRGCNGLTSLPESLGHLKALQHLDLSWCISLTSLPESLGHLKALQHLDLRRCEGLTSLPKSLGGLLKAPQHLVLPQ
ncbi:unnamed protein product [Chrysoparadoxa australica]